MALVRRCRTLAVCLVVAWCVPPMAAVCPCQKQLSVCNEVAAEGSVVFIGVVESITPKALGYWNPSRRPVWDTLNAAYDRVAADPSPQALLEWKGAIRNLFPDLPDHLKEELGEARTHSSLLKVFNEVMGSGTQVRFHVETVFRNGDDDDDDNHSDLAPKKEFSLWTPFGDCGVDFQAGERYLVYAVSDEGTDERRNEPVHADKTIVGGGEGSCLPVCVQNYPKAAGRSRESPRTISNSNRSMARL